MDKFLGTPALSLRAFGKLIDQKTGQTIAFDPTAITYRLQNEIVEYYSAPPLTDFGQTRWLNVLGYRQGGKSTCPEMCAYVKTAYTPGYDHVCLEAGTKVLRPDGTLTAIGDLEVGDLVRTHTNAIAPVSHKWVVERAAVEVRVQSYNRPVICSEDHKHWTQRGMVQAKDLRPDDRLGFPRRRITCGGTLKPCPGPKDRWGNPRPHAWVEAPQPTFAVGRIVGLYLAEGSIPRMSRGGWIDWCVHVDEIERTQAWLVEAGVDAERIKVAVREGNGANVLVHSTPMSVWMYDLCSKKSTKHVPAEWWTYPEEFLRGLVHGYMSGDGYARDGQVVVPSVSPALIHQVREIICTLYGAWGTIRHKPAHEQAGMRKQESWYLQYNGDISRHLARNLGLGEFEDTGNPGWGTGPIVDEEYVWLHVEAVTRTGTAVKMVDIEVDHPDHSFCLPQFATSNCIADVKSRAEYLHRRVHVTHRNWDERYRAETAASREMRQLTFAHGGRMRVLTGDGDAVGIGQSPDSFHGSELPYWRDAGRQFSMIYPSIINRNHSLVVLESTPSPMIEPSAEWWRDQCNSAKEELDRWQYLFLPFWDGKLNARPWKPEDRPSREELALLDKYGHLGLRLENLAFRRTMMDTDSKIRRNPDLFRVYYPFDDITCWVSSAGAIFRPDVLDKHAQRAMTEWVGPYMEYEQPEPGAVYVIGVDPAGYGLRDHASFQVLKVWHGEWTQVATFAAVAHPKVFADKLIEVGLKYNNAMVGVESNGVGTATLALLEAAKYPRLYYSAPYKPGIPATKQGNAEMLSFLQDALMDEFMQGKINDDRTVAHLGTYKQDKLVEQSETSELLGTAAGRRRERHHWDRISALMIACKLAREAPRRYRQKDLEVVASKDSSEMTAKDWQSYRKEVSKSQGQTKRDKRRRARYTRRRR